MAKKIRLIARLDVKNNYLVKGIQLEGLRKLGDPHIQMEIPPEKILRLFDTAYEYGRGAYSDRKR